MPQVCGLVEQEFQSDDAKTSGICQGALGTGRRRCDVRKANLLVAASEKFGKCVQHGTQYRSTADVQAGVRALRDGVIGRVLTAKAINHQLRKPIGRSPVSNPPNGVDYDLWLGPAPKHDFTRNRWHYNWHWFWDYGCGDLANDGIHQLDVAIWGMDAGYPEAIVTLGGQLFYDDDHETPDTQTIVFEYARMQILFPAIRTEPEIS